MGLTASLRSKGPRGFAIRVTDIGRRFGVSSRSMETRLGQYRVLAAEHGLVPTLPITAVLMRRHPAAVRRLAGSGVELAVHGLVHNDHTRMTLAEQRATLGTALQLFAKTGVPTQGFRAPYLRANGATDEAVRSVGLLYDSSDVAAFPVAPRLQLNDAYRRVCAYYRPYDANRFAVRPRMSRGLVRIPVTIPDDEILVDRFQLGPDDQERVWLDILATTFRREELFTLQIHPERVGEVEQALRAVLVAAAAMSPRVWLATCAEVAAWWTRRATATLELATLEPDRHVVHLAGPDDAWLRLTGQLPPGGTRRDDTRSSIEVIGPAPVVGVEPDAPAELRTFLTEEGFLIRSCPDPATVAAFVPGTSADFDEQAVLAALKRSPHPLVQLARWPVGCRSALTLSGDIDALTLGDFVARYWQSTRMWRRRATAGPRTSGPEKGRAA